MGQSLPDDVDLPEGSILSLMGGVAQLLYGNHRFGGGKKIQGNEKGKPDVRGGTPGFRGCRRCGGFGVLSTMFEAQFPYRYFLNAFPSGRVP